MANATEFKIKIKPEFDVNEFKRAFQKITNGDVKLNFDAKAAQKELLNFADGLKKLQSQMAGADVEPAFIEQLSKSINELINKELPALEEGMDAALKANSGDSVIGIRKLSEELYNSAKSSVELANEQKKALRQLEETGKKGTNEYVKLEKELQETESQMKKLYSTAEQTSDKLNFADRMAKFGLVAQGIQSATGSLNQLSAGFVGLDTATAKIKSLGTEAKSISGDLKAMSLEMSNNSALSAVDIQTASYDALSAGIKATKQDMESFMGAAAKLAVGGSESINNTVNLLSSLINAYGESASETQRYSDVLSMTANLGKTSIAEMISTMSNVVPTASAMGFSIESVGGALALLTANGVPTAQATTMLNGVLTEMQKPTAELKKVLDKTGLSVEELGAKVKSGDVVGAFRDLDGALKKAGSNATVAFGDVAGKGFNILAKDFDKLQEMMDGVAQSSGATESAYNEMSQTIENRSKEAQNKVENFVTSLIEGSGAFGTFAVTAGQVADKMNPTLTALTGMKALLGNLPKEIISKFLPAIVAMITGTTSATGAQTGLNAAMSANPIGLVVLAVAGLVAILAVFFTKTDEGRKMWEKLKATFEQVWKVIKPIFEGWLNYFKAYFVAFIKFNKFLFKLIITPLETLGNVILWVINKFLKLAGAGSKVENIGVLIKKVFDGVAWTIGRVGELFDYLGKKFDQLKGWIAEAVNAIPFIGDEADKVQKKLAKPPLRKKEPPKESPKQEQVNQEQQAKKEEKHNKQAIKNKETLIELAEKEYQKAQKNLQLADEKYNRELQQKAIAEKRVLTAEEERQIELRKLETAKESLKKYADILKAKKLITDFDATTGEVKFGKVKAEDKERIREAISSQLSNITSQEYRLIPTFDKKAFDEERRNYQMQLDKEALTLKIEAGEASRADIDNFINSTLQRYSEKVETLKAELAAVSDDAIDAEKRRFELGKQIHEVEKQKRDVIKEQQGYYKDLYSKVVAEHEKAEAKKAEISEKFRLKREAVERQVFGDMQKAYLKLNDLEKSKELDRLGAEEKNKLARAGENERAKELIQKDFNKRKLKIEKDFQEQRDVLEALHNGTLLAIQQEAELAKLESERKFYEKKLALATEYGDEKGKKEAEKELEALAKATQEKGDILANSMAIIGNMANEALANALAGDNEAAKNAMKKNLAMLAGYLKKMAITYVVNIVLESSALKAIAAAAGPLAPIVTGTQIGLITGAMNALLNPLLNKVLSFSTGGYVDKPTLFVAGDASLQGGSNRELILRDEQFNKALDESAKRNAIASATLIAGAISQSMPNGLVANIKGTDLQLILTRVENNENRRIR